MTSPANLIDRAARRQELIDLLRDGPYVKRDILAKLDMSRSTLDRAVEELLEAGLITRRDDGYETTLPGVLALKTRRSYDRDAKALAATEAAIRPLWKESAVDIALLRDATVTLFEQERTVGSFATLRTALQTATAVRAHCPAVAANDHLDALYDQVTDGTTVQLTTSESLFDELRTAYPGWLRAVARAESGAVRVGEVPEFGLYVCELADSTQVFLIVYDDGRPHALLQNDTEDAVEWAERTVDRVHREAAARQEEIDAIPADAPFAEASANGPVFGEQTATASRTEGSAGEDSALLGSGYSVDGGRLRTPAFGAQGACSVTLWLRPENLRDGWQLLVKWDYLAIGLRRGQVWGHVFDPEAERKRARVEASLDHLADRTWSHCAYTYDETTARLYIDGEVVAEASDDYPVAIDPIGAAVGYMYRDRDTGVHDPTFHGQISDARFYETALTADAVRQLYRTTSPPGRHRS